MPVSPPTPPAVPEVLGMLCQNVCPWANDNVCDDGRVGAATASCYFATDCADCGVMWLGPCEVMAVAIQQITNSVVDMSFCSAANA